MERARFHLSDGRPLVFDAVPSSLLGRRTGELLAALVSILLLLLVLALARSGDGVRSRHEAGDRRSGPARRDGRGGDAPTRRADRLSDPGAPRRGDAHGVPAALVRDVGPNLSGPVFPARRFR